MSAQKRQNPEGAALSAITAYLKACGLGKIHRVNVGQLRVGNAPTHPWAKDTRRFVRFGEPGAADLVVELAGEPREIHIEVKRPGWTPPKKPQPGASASTWKAYHHHCEQEAFLNRQRVRGNFAFFARSVNEVYSELVRLGFKRVPVPSHGCPQVRSNAPRKGQSSGGDPQNDSGGSQ